MVSSETPIAFFDVDETLIATKSMFDFLAFLGKSEPLVDAEAITAEMRRLSDTGRSRGEINVAFWRSFAGLSQNDVQRAAQAWTGEKLSNSDNFFVTSGISQLAEHKRDGHLVALVSGSAVDILAALAAELEANYVLATRLHVVDGHYTGTVLSPVMIGEGKREAAQNLIDEIDVNPDSCFAYGDHLSDLPLLELVGHPVVIGTRGQLAELAGRRGWPVLPGMETMHQSGEFV